MEWIRWMMKMKKPAGWRAAFSTHFESGSPRLVSGWLGVSKTPQTMPASGVQKNGIL
jgi:hypothetical protein